MFIKALSFASLLFPVLTCFTVDGQDLYRRMFIITAHACSQAYVDMSSKDWRGGSKDGAGVREKLIQWDSQLAVLSERQKDCFIDLSSCASDRPLPPNVSSEHLITVFISFYLNVVSPLYIATSRRWPSVGF